jgi:hypothetical protein
MPTEDFNAVTETLLGAPLKNTPAPISDRTLENVVYQDFLTYRYLLDPADTRVLELSGLTPSGSKFIDALEEQSASFETLDYIAEFLGLLEALVISAFDQAIPTAQNTNRFGVMQPTLNSPTDTARKVLHQLYTTEPFELWSLLDHHAKTPNFLWDFLFPTFMREARKIHRQYSGQVMANPDGHSSPGFRWAGLQFGLSEGPSTHVPLDYPFEIFPANATNIGIALIYRQRWRPMGMQPGEVVRTVPLGPGQIEKVSTKITRRRKSKQDFESSSESETSTETSDTTKDSSEILNEASRSKKWNIEAEASYGGFGFGGSVSAGTEGAQASSSKETTSSLSEVMEKTASKIKKQSKVSVSTETETGFEQESASTITNPNDEIALTYYYHTLQQQYEVFTYLAEVRNVVFVAERVPAPIEVNETWVRQHDWILAAALLDQSFSETLGELISDVDEEDLLGAQETDPYRATLLAAQGKFASFNTNGGGGDGGLSLPDIYSEPQRQLDSYLRDKAERTRSNARREMRRRRLYDHLRQNILHYCRAIWAAEDADQRALRYRKEGRTVPIVWEGPLIDADQNTVSLSDLAPNGVTADLGDILDVTGPIGYSGNYAVFPLRQLDPDQLDASVLINDAAIPVTITLPLQEVLNQAMRAPYARGGRLRDPALALFEAEAETIIRHAENKQDVAADALTYEAPSDALVHEIVSYLPEKAALLVDATGVLRAPGGKLQNPVSLVDFASFLHRRNGTRRFLVESNNLYVSIHRGDGTALEPFKQAHRYLDVLQAQEDLVATRLKNQRRTEHMEDPGGYDPDIEKVVIVSNDDLARNAAGHESDTDGGGVGGGSG